MLQNLRLVSRLDARPLAFLEIFCGFFPLPSSASSSFSLFFFLGVLVYFFSFCGGYLGISLFVLTNRRFQMSVRAAAEERKRRKTGERDIKEKRNR